MARISNRYRTPGLSTNCSAIRHRNASVHRGVWAAIFVGYAIATASDGESASALALFALAVYFAYRARERLRMASSFQLGAEAEMRVAALLEEAAGWGWTVEHDVLKKGGGNIDHVVHSASVTFAIDTKRSRWRERDLAQAHRHAGWAARHYGAARPIVPVICIQRSGDPAIEVDGVVIVGSARLLGFLGSTQWPDSISFGDDPFQNSRREAEFEELFGIGA